MDKLIPIFLILSMIIIGFIIKLFELKRVNKRIDFTNDYRNKFINFTNSLFSKKFFDQQLYYQLTADVKEMQYELGQDGIFAHAVDGLTGYSTHNYQLLINFLPELRTAHSEMDNSIIMMRISKSVGDCDDMFIRHLGSLNTYNNNLRKNVFNPFSCFAEGIRSIVSLPVMMLNWLGFLSDANTDKIKHSWVIGFLNFIAVILGLIGSVFTIILGWEQVSEMIHTFISSL